MPIINQDGLVVMDISQNISQPGDDVIIDGNAVPSTIERNAQSYVAVHDRDTIMLGGFISTTKSKSNSGKSTNESRILSPLPVRRPQMPTIRSGGTVTFRRYLP